MFELSIALKYLIPRKKQLSISLIALLSVAVISLVVWLVVIFLSVTEGIERNWLYKLTTLNAPLRIHPTPYYYASYYYQIDSLSSDAQYTSKNIAEKAAAQKSDPYNAIEDEELPSHFPSADRAENGMLKDPVLGLFAVLGELKRQKPDLVYQDFELSGALMRLQLLRPSFNGQNTQGYLTQVSYLASIPDQCPQFSSLLLPHTENDLNHLLFLATHTTQVSCHDNPGVTERANEQLKMARIADILQDIKIQELKPNHALWQMPFFLLPEEKIFSGIPRYRNGSLTGIHLPVRDTSACSVKIYKKGGALFLEEEGKIAQQIAPNTPLFMDSSMRLQVTAAEKNPLLFQIQAGLQGSWISGKVSMDGLQVSKAHLDNWHPMHFEKETGVLLAKGFLDNGVLIGDRGYLSYSSATSSSVQEHRLPIFVKGFYDPGILSVGNKCILVPSFVTRTINSSSSSFNLDKTQSNGVCVWFDDLQQAEKIKVEILAGLKQRGLEKYWAVTTFRNYDFAKDLLQQFQSDKYLFTLIGIIILTVACCNIISMLVLLVNDKKKEIGILQAMGASRLSIAAIFGTCGMVMGLLSSLIGITAAILTLHHMDSIVQFLSFVQGHAAFNSSFFGKSLPNDLSQHAVSFIVIITPLLSLLAGLIPAFKACRLSPSQIVRAES